MSAIEKLLQGSIDMHIHYGPDPTSERRSDALEGARQAQEAGMRAIVLKSHEYPTAPVAYTVSQVVPDITVLGSIALDLEVGGLNPDALKASAKMGAKVVWMPTMTSANDMKKKGLSGGITIVDDDGNLLPVLQELFTIVKEYQMVLATGHIAKAESFALVDAARKAGISKIVVTHPLLEKLGAPLTITEQQQMAEKGAFIEHCFGITMPMERLDPMRIVEAVRAVGAERCIVSTDLGQAHNPAPAEGMRVAIATLLKCGLSAREVELMVKVNPAKLLGLD